MKACPRGYSLTSCGTSPAAGPPPREGPRRGGSDRGTVARHHGAGPSQVGFVPRRHAVVGRRRRTRRGARAAGRSRRPGRSRRSPPCPCRADRPPGDRAPSRWRRRRSGPAASDRNVETTQRIRAPAAVERRCQRQVAVRGEAVGDRFRSGSCRARPVARRRRARAIAVGIARYPGRGPSAEG